VSALALILALGCGARRVRDDRSGPSGSPERGPDVAIDVVPSRSGDAGAAPIPPGASLSDLDPCGPRQPPPRAEIVGTEEEALRRSLVRGRAHPADVDPAAVDVGGARIPVADIREAARAILRASSPGGIAEVEARREPIRRAFAAAHGGAAIHEAERAYEGELRRIFERRFGFRTFNFYSNSYERPVVVQGTLPDLDGTHVPLQWSEGTIRLMDRGTPGMRAAWASRRLGFQPGTVRPIASDAVARAYCGVTFWALADVRAGPDAMLASADPAPEGSIVREGPPRAVTDLGRGLRPARDLDAARTASAAIASLLVRDERAAAPDDVVCRESGDGRECRVTVPSSAGRRLATRIVFDSRGRLAGAFGRDAGHPDAVEAAVLHAPVDCRPSVSAAGPRQVAIAASEAEFARLYGGCAEPSGIDWRAERLALLSFGGRDDVSFTLDRARRRGGGPVVVDLLIPHVACRGVEPADVVHVVAVRLAAGRAPVEAGEVRDVSRPCGPVP
jgi:hypothetical protein